MNKRGCVVNISPDERKPDKISNEIKWSWIKLDKIERDKIEADKMR